MIYINTLVYISTINTYIGVYPMEIEVTFVSASRRVGVSNKSGSPRPYDISSFQYAVAGESSEKENNSFRIHGSQIRELPLNPDKLNEFSGLKIGQQVKILLSPDPNMLNRNRVDGLSK